MRKVREMVTLLNVTACEKETLYKEKHRRDRYVSDSETEIQTEKKD
jgi:hypothetical protein